MLRGTLKSVVAVAGLAVLGLAAAPISQAAMDKTGWPSSVKVGTASQGGTYFIYGAGWAGLMQEMLGIGATAEVTGGPVANMALVNAGDLQFGMITMGPGYDSWNGESEMAPGVEMRNVRALFPMYATPFHAIAMKASNIAKVADLNGKRVNVGPRTGTAATYWGRMFEALGVKANLQYGNASDAAGQLQDNLIDTFAFAAGIPISAFSEVEAQKPATIFAFTAEEQAKLIEQFPSMTAFTIPKGTYRSQEADILTVSMANFGIASKDLPESLVYEVMKVVLDNNDRMMQIHQTAAETKSENWSQNGFMWFHPGAIRYYKEKGIEIPKNLIPPEYKG
ncbi:MAG: TAXI family TRAP transporter solute-binding subunit [Candidatus Competibacteraceae bacterium]|nr:TAXI family TRAP transporter solute-binding subunit [Candidatus Competibacteraceae bacterium]